MRPTGQQHADGFAPRHRQNWPKLRPLPEQHEISAQDGALLEQTIAIGSPVPVAALPTLWRHLIHWPGLIRAVIDQLAPLHASGTLFRAVEDTIAWTASEAPFLPHLIDRAFVVPEAAVARIEDYIGQPPPVTRMSTVGKVTVTWLRASDALV